MSRRASRDCATDASVAAFTVASTRALIDAGSIVVAVNGVGVSKKGSSRGVGDGDGVRVARALSRACGEGKRKFVGSWRVDLVEGRLDSAAVSGVGSASACSVGVAPSDARDAGSDAKRFQYDMEGRSGGDRVRGQQTECNDGYNTK